MSYYKTNRNKKWTIILLHLICLAKKLLNESWERAELNESFENNKRLLILRIECFLYFIMMWNSSCKSVLYYENKKLKIKRSNR